MALEWREAMSIDGGVIDDDHKCLIGLINSLESISPGPTMHALLDVAIARLLTYVQIHFEREERLQTASGFLYAQAHRSRHRTILRDMHTMLAECKQLSPEVLPQFHARLSTYLYDWLCDHVLKADMLMKPFVIEMRRHVEHIASLPDAVRMAIDNECPRAPSPYRQLLLPSGAGRRRHI